jgi:hypothetical protein
MHIRNTFITILILLFLITQSTFAFGESVSVPSPSKVLAYHKPNVTILCNDQELGFTDVNGTAVYPIIYVGTTYIPVRGVSRLMGENIEWEPMNQIVFIGKTISQPFKGMGSVDSLDTSVLPLASRPEQKVITVYLKPDVKIMYDFVIQEFRDVNQRVVYPIIYQGTTYLPVRAISGLMGASIEWNSNTQTITINKEVVDQEEERSNVLALTDLFNQAVDLYNQSTSKISILQSTQDPAVLQMMAKEVSSDYRMAQYNTSFGKELGSLSFTPSEKEAYDKLMEFLELAEYYILVLENISYMASNGQDYSMFGETFLTFALESERKMDETREAIQAL